MANEEKVKHLILAKGYSNLKEFCTRNDISYTTFLSLMDNGLTNARVGTVQKLAKALDLQVDQLLSEELLDQYLIGGQKPVTSQQESLMDNPFFQQIHRICSQLDSSDLEEVANFALFRQILGSTKPSSPEKYNRVYTFDGKKLKSTKIPSQPFKKIAQLKELISQTQNERQGGNEPKSDNTKYNRRQKNSWKRPTTQENESGVN